MPVILRDVMFYLVGFVYGVAGLSPQQGVDLYAVMLRENA